MRRLRLLVLVLGTTAASWIDPHATARDAARLYDEGRFAEAAAKYREALVDDPDSPLLHYNAGLASYRDGKHDDALAALGAVPSSDTEPGRTARAAYAAGNAKYRIGAAAEAEKPQEALERYAEALAAYRRAMGADPADEDAKFNHELVEKKIADLKKRLEEEREKQQEQEQQQQDQQQQNQQQQNQQQQNQQQQNQQQQDERQQDQQQGQQQQDRQQQDQQQQDEQQGQPRQEEQAQASDEPAERDERQPAGAGSDVAGDEATDEMSPREAQALLDAQRDQEVRPEEVIRRLEHGRVAEPREDW